MTAANDGGEWADSDDEPGSAPSMEQLFDCRELPTWKEQLTARALAVSLILGFLLSFVVMKMSLSTGIIPTLNVSAGLLGFFLVKTWTKVLEKAGFVQNPFTRQENTIIQTCVVACSSIAFSGGFGSYILAMSGKVALGFDKANTSVNIKNPSIGWMIIFLFIVSLIGLFSVVPLSKIMILGYNLTYPSGTATAHLINSFHTPQGAELAKKQVSILFKSFGGSLFWAMFQWFYTAAPNCGFSAFPTFGLTAFGNKFYFDFSATYVGVGMLCPPIVNFSLLLGSFISWGILWPYIESKKGEWYSAELPANSLNGLSGYKVFIAIALILGDGVFQFSTVLFKSVCDMRDKLNQPAPAPPPCIRLKADPPAMSFDDRRRTKVFLKDQIPTKVIIGGYASFIVISIATVPRIFPQLRPYHIAAAYLIAPIFAFCNAYGAGLTDWSLATTYGKLAILIFGAWVGLADGGVLAGLAACGLMLSIVSTASDIMQDFKTGYLTLTSQRSMFVSQAIGMAMGCVVGPTVFWFFYRAFPLGAEGSDYPATYARVYRGIAILGVQGSSALPKNCLSFCAAAFFLGIAINSAREVAKRMGWWVADYTPSVMGMAVPFYLGSYFTIDMCVGGILMKLWERADRRQARTLGPAVASGMMCGDGIWSLPASLLSMGGVSPPMCMRFLSGADNRKVDALLVGTGPTG